MAIIWGGAVLPDATFIVRPAEVLCNQRVEVAPAEVCACQVLT